MRSLLEDINRPRIEAIEQAQQAMYHNRAGMWGLHDQPDMTVPTVPRYALLNVRALVERFVLPLTSALQAPLWAYVPTEQRGKPDFFVSHTWNSLLLGPHQQEIGTLDAIEHLDHYAWIDFVAYNQHTIESMPTDMEAVIGEIGKVIFAGTPVPTLGRIWCLWELLCANRTGIDFDIAIRPGYRNDKILAVNTLYRSFVGVEKAVATKPEDLKIISDEVLAQFGSAQTANEHFDRILRERFSGSWYELRERDQHLGLRPWPWLYEQSPSGEALANRPVREPDPYYGAGIRDSVIYGSQQTTFDLLIESGLKVSYDDEVAHQFRVISASDLALFEAAGHGDLPKVQELLEQDSDTDRPIANYSALAAAARGGHARVVELLLKSGADIEGGNGVSPLAAAAWNGQDEIVRLLIERGADIEGDTGGPGTALFQASDEGHLSTVRLLLDLGAAVDAKTEKRATPLLIATANGHLEVVVQLIAAGVDLDCTDRSGDTALHHAAHNGSAAIVQALVNAGADRTVVDKYGDTAFDIGKREGRLDAATLALLQVVSPADLDGSIDSRQIVDPDAELRGGESAETPKGDGPTEQSLVNLAVMSMNCPGCGEPLRCFMRPRYFYSEEPGSVWSDFLDGLPRNRCKCGLKVTGSASSFHTDSWTAVTLEPPRAFPAEVFAELVNEVLTGVQHCPPLLLFESFEEIHRAVSGGTSQPFLLMPYSSLIYQGVSETARTLHVLIIAAVSAGLCADAYLFIKNAAAIHPDIFWVFFDAARELARIVDEASTGDSGLLEDLESLSRQLAGWRKAPALDPEAVFVCFFGENAATSEASDDQIYYTLRGYFDNHQDLRFLEGDKACSSLPSWLLPKPNLSPAHKCLLDVHIHAAGEFLLRHNPTAAQTISDQMCRARERIASRYSKLSEAERTQAREFYSTVGGRDLLDVL
ncbi:ankyrin repeat domain-containing protein [Mesorhizobium escarrei]|uniref:ankyrin repeat domain-containing protein n=1 Tax=Mesorhizobium escarrei TaxID=666018 RepID=UPI0020A7728A|nr:ankyrin repeat domain-containing protein [Mesorhizobium escarrei]